ncbi:MAG: hypothetical protein ABEH90_02875, partial [Halolamina sp.]
ETGKMLIKIGKRGRKHGLGIVGMSQRPADVKKDFITQCDWLVWHRLTWDNDTRVVGRILGTEYADRVEELDDGEAFLDADWDEDVRRVQFDRKRTFDAGATPGLGDFERPELQSVSEDLVADLQQVSEERERHESELSALEAELAEKEQRIDELEAELAEARDMSEMADRFAQALVENAETSPPENAPAEPEVAEAEEFVAGAARGGYPGAGPVPADADAVDADAGPSETAPDAATGSGETSNGGARDGEEPREDADSEEPKKDVDGEESREDADGEGLDAGANGERPGENEQAAGTEETEELLNEDQRELYEYEADAEPAVRADAVDDGPDEVTADDQTKTGDEAEQKPAKNTEDGEAAESAESNGPEDPAADQPLDAEEAEPDGPQPVRTVSSGEEPSTDISTEAGETEEEAGDDVEAEEETTAAEETADSTNEPASGAQSAEGADTVRETERETFEATGDWPNADSEGADPIDRDEPLTAGKVSTAEGIDGSEELEQRLAEQFGVVMETDSDLTGGTLGGTTDEDPVEPSEDGSGGSSADEGTEPESAGGSEDRTDPESEAEPDSDPNTSKDSDGRTIDPTADRVERLTELVEGPELRVEAEVVRAFVHGIQALDDATRRMLEHYRQAGDDSPVEAHVAAGGSGERQYAYARNRTLRMAGLIEHVGGGRYRYRLPALVEEAYDERIDDRTLANTVESIEAATSIAAE